MLVISVTGDDGNTVNFDQEVIDFKRIINKCVRMNLLENLRVSITDKETNEKTKYYCSSIYIIHKLYSMQEDDRFFYNSKVFNILRDNEFMLHNESILREMEVDEDDFNKRYTDRCNKSWRGIPKELDYQMRNSMLKEVIICDIVSKKKAEYRNQKDGNSTSVSSN